MADPRPLCRVRVERSDGTIVGDRTLHGFGDPDLDSLDAVARLLLAARRAGERVVVVDAVPALWELLELAGLPVEVGGEAEAGEHLARVEQVEEEAHLGDAPV
mgnify:CR=1 FL=1